MAWAIAVAPCLAIFVCTDAKINSANVGSMFSHTSGIIKKSSPPDSLASLLLSGTPLAHRSRCNFANAPRSHCRVTAAATGFGTQDKQRSSKSKAKPLAPKNPSKFLAWANQYSKTELRLADFDGIRGVSASQDIGAGEQVMKMPPSAAIEVNSLTRSPEWCDEEVWKKSKWDAKLAMKLLRLMESKEGAKKETTSEEFNAWIEQLPKEFDTPIYNSEVLAGLNLMKYTALTTAVDIQRKEWDEARKRAQSVGIAVEHFDWAMSVVRSRAFSGNYKPGTFVDAMLQLFVANSVAVGYSIWTGSAGASELAQNGFFVVLTYILLNEFVVGPFFVAPKLKQYVLCPMIDMFNHDSELGGSEIGRDYISNNFMLRLDSQAGAIEKGSELKISYGPRTNDNLLQYYGFVETNNPHDIYKIDFLSFVERLNKVRGIADDDAAKKRTASILVDAELEFDLGQTTAIAFTADGVDEFGKRIARLLVNPELALKDSGRSRLDGDAEEEVISVLVEIAKDAKEDLLQAIPEVSGVRTTSASRVLQAFAAEKLRVLSASIIALS